MQQDKSGTPYITAGISLLVMAMISGFMLLVNDDKAAIKILAAIILLSCGSGCVGRGFQLRFGLSSSQAENANESVNLYSIQNTR
jgi:hypothetical protein